MLQFALQSYPSNTLISCRMVEALLIPLYDDPQGATREEEHIGGSGGGSRSGGTSLSRCQTVTDRDILGEALQVAAGEGYVLVIPALLAAGADPNYFSPCDEYRMTPLIGMIFEQNPGVETHVDILKLLLEAGVDLSHISNEWTAHDYALHYDRQDLLPLLRSV